MEEIREYSKDNGGNYERRDKGKKTRSEKMHGGLFAIQIDLPDILSMLAPVEIVQHMFIPASTAKRLRIASGIMSATKTVVWFCAFLTIWLYFPTDSSSDIFSSSIYVAMLVMVTTIVIGLSITYLFSALANYKSRSSKEI
jgi:ABC-type spermidine/putrescine transport system permease subunit I